VIELGKIKCFLTTRKFLINISIFGVGGISWVEYAVFILRVFFKSIMKRPHNIHMTSPERAVL
jgi:hypothetical protein